MITYFSILCIFTILLYVILNKTNTLHTFFDKYLITSSLIVFICVCISNTYYINNNILSKYFYIFMILLCLIGFSITILKNISLYNEKTLYILSLLLFLSIIYLISVIVSYMGLPTWFHSIIIDSIRILL